MKSVLGALALLCSVVISDAQESRDIYVIKSIGLDNEDDFQDLEPLKRAIGNARIVELADWASADDGASYDGINRLIHFLHSEMSFDIIVWPLGVYEGFLINKSFMDGDTNTGLKPMYRVWRNSRSIGELAQYIADQRYSNPLQMLGSSCQYHAYGKKSILNFLRQEAVAVEVEEQIIHKLDQVDSLWSKNPRLKSLSQQELVDLKRMIDELISELTDANWNNSMITSFLDNMKWFVELEEIRGYSPADELEEMVAKYLTKSTFTNMAKIISANIEQHKIILFGSWENIRNQWAQDIYSIGITSYNGQIGRPGQDISAMEPITDQYVETYLHGLRKPFLFVESKDLDFVDKVSRLNGKSRTSWRREFDAIFFIDRSYPNSSKEGDPK